MFHLNVYSHLYDLSLIRNSWLFIDFFFVLSGFVISSAYSSRLNSSTDILRFMIRRFGRLWPLHMFVLMALVVLEFLKWSIAQMGMPVSHEAFTGQNSLWALLTNAFLIQSLGMHDFLSWNFPSYSISIEFYIYLIFALFCIALQKQNKGVATGALAAVTMASFAIACSEHGRETACDFGLFRYFCGFVCGVILFSIHEAFSFRFTRLGASAAEFLALAGAVAFVCLAGSSVYGLAAPFVFSAVVFVYAKQQGVFSDIMLLTPFQKLGEWSYSIYMVHFFVVCNLLSRPFAVIEKLTGASLTQGASVALGPEVNRVIVLGGKSQADLLTLAYVLIVIFIARQTHLYIEKPWRAYFNEVAASAETFFSRKRRRGMFSPRPVSASFLAAGSEGENSRTPALVGKEDGASGQLLEREVASDAAT